MQLIMLENTEISAILYTFQFEDTAATKLKKRNKFGVAFFIHALMPLIYSSAWNVWMSNIGLDSQFLMEIIIHFSPLSKWDLYSLWVLHVSYTFMPLTLHKSYSGMDKKLTDFVQLFSQSMHGIICKGIGLQKRQYCIYWEDIITIFRRYFGGVR